MSDTRAALEAALVANPDDAAAHAAYADFLIEAGDPRGEYIRLQLALEVPDLPANVRWELWRRQYDLWQAHSAEWVGPFAGHSAGFIGQWRRGWVTAIRVRRVTPGLFGLIATAPETRLVRNLDLSGSGAGDDGVDDLIESGLIDRLDGLDLGRCHVTDDGAIALAACPAVPKLKSLCLDWNDLSPVGVEALFRVGVKNVGPQTFVPDARSADAFED